MTTLKMVILFFAAVLVTVGYSIPVEAPKRSILPSCLGGGISFVVYLKTLDLGGSLFLSAFIAALLTGMLGEFFSRRFKMPATIFIMPGLIPLVPGGGMYYTMYYLIQENMDLFVREAINTFSVAMALSLGIVASGLFSQSLRAFRKRSLGYSKPFFYSKRH